MTREEDILLPQETISQATAGLNPRFFYDTKYPAVDDTIGVHGGAVPMVLDKTGKIVFVPKDMVEVYKSRGALVATV